MLSRNPITAFTTLVFAGGLSLAHAGESTHEHVSEPPSTLAKSTPGKSYEQCCAKAQSRWGRWQLDRPFLTGDFGENGQDLPISGAVRKVLTRLSLRPSQTGNTYPGLHLDWTPPPLDAVPLSPRLSHAAYSSTAPEPIEKKGLRWLPAIAQSLFLTGIQHAIRMKEEATRGRVSGPFFPGWFESAGSLFDGGWGDGGRDFTNYLAHPAAGSAWGYIYRQNHRSEKTLEIAWNRSYVSHLGKSMLWSFVWSLQFEIGPFSESSLGSVLRGLSLVFPVGCLGGYRYHSRGRSRGLECHGRRTGSLGDQEARIEDEQCGSRSASSFAQSDSVIRKADGTQEALAPRRSVT